MLSVLILFMLHRLMTFEQWCTANALLYAKQTTYQHGQRYIGICNFRRRIARYIKCETFRKLNEFEH